MYGTPIVDTAEQGVRARRVKVEESPAAGTRRRTTIQLIDYPVALQDEAGVGGFATLTLYTFPADLVLFVGASLNMKVERQAVSGDSAGLSATWQGDAGVGSVAAVGHSIATTKSDYVPTTATDGSTVGSDSDAVAGVATVHGVSGAISGATGGPRLIDATGGTTAVIFNLLVDDADQDATGHPVNVVLNGRVAIEWEIVGEKVLASTY